MSDIIKTQQGFARKAETNRTHRFEDLYHLLCKSEWIEEALQHVLDNDGAGTAGVDGMSWKAFHDVDKSDFENEKFRQRFIESLQEELRKHTFKPMPVRRVEIPKPGTNKKRPLGIPTLKDRVVQTMLKMLMEPIWEADFFYFSNGCAARTMYDGLYSTLVHALQYHHQIPMGDRGGHQSVFRSCILMPP